MDKITISTPVSMDMDMRARVVAARSRVSKSEIVRRALADYLKRAEKRAKKSRAAAA